MKLPFEQIEEPEQQAFKPAETGREYDPIEVMLGGAAEVGIDVASFGAFSPDIIPDYAERNSPIAYFIGSTAGMIAGMYPSFGTAGLALKGTKALFNTFNFSRKVLTVAETMSKVEQVAQTAKPFSRIGTTMSDTAAVFAIHDTAREIVRQVKESDPNLYQIGHSAATGAIGGMYLGMVGKYTHDLHPAAQAVSMGAAMSLAEAITDRAEGIDVLSSDYMKNRLPKVFLQGMAFGLWNSRGWKARKEAMQEFDIAVQEADMMQYLNREGKIDPSKIKPIGQMLEEIGGVPANVKRAIESYDSEWGQTPELYTPTGPSGKVNVGKPKPSPKKHFKFGTEEIAEIRKTLTLEQTLEKLKPETEFVGEQVSPTFEHTLRRGYEQGVVEGQLGQYPEFGKVNGIDRTVGVGGKTTEGYDKVITNPSVYASEYSMVEYPKIEESSLRKQPIFEAVLKDIVGKKPSEKLTPTEEKISFDTFKKLEVVNLQPSSNKFREAGFLEEHLKPADQVLTDTNLIVFAENPTIAKNLMTLRETHLVNFGYSMKGTIIDKVRKFMPNRLPSSKEAFGAKVKGKTPKELEVFADIIEGKIPQTELHPEINRLVGIYKNVTDYFWHATNQVRELQGEQPLTYKEFYMMHQLDVPEMIRRGYSRKQIPTPEVLAQGVGLGKGVGSNIKSVTEISRTKNEYPMKRDPLEALNSMVHNDLRVIYLNEPVRIMNAQLTKAKEMGAIEEPAIKTLNHYMEQVIMSRPTEASAKFNRAMVGFADTAPGKVIDKFAAYFGKDIFNNTARQINSFVGRMTTRAFISAKPKMAIRNAMQFLFGYGRVSAKSLGQALLPIDHPKILTDNIENSMFYKMTKEYAGEEYIHASKGFTGRADTMANDLFSKSAVQTVRTNMMAAGYDTLAKIRDPKRNWGDAEGHRLRSESGDMNKLSARETTMLKERMDAIANYSNYLYTATGMPMIFRSDVAAPFVKLMSFQMNYVYKTIGGMAYELTHKSPKEFAYMGKDAPTLNWNERLGLFKHFVGLGMLVAAIEKTLDLDYSSLLGLSYNANGDGVREKINVGVFDIRPNPSMTLFLGMKKMLFAQEEWQREEGKRDLLNAFPVPYKQAYKDWEKALSEGKVEEMFLYKPYKKKISYSPKLKSTNPFGKPFGGGLSKPFGGGF